METPDLGSDGLQIDIDEAGDTTLRLTGDLDAASATGVWRRLDELEPTGTITIDLSEVGLVDSSGIGCLFRLSQLVSDADAVLVATGASPPLRSLMETTGLNRVIAILP